ncbi:hypothetical protein BYT27DRAFT_7207572 [Phlegmacium glaucopus]|nr:hypothetical protein BYT27DRAFT_7207572 [Phlegmacium glaucopus]
MEVLAEPHGAQASFSSETQSVAWKTIPILELLQTLWEIMYDTPKFLPVADALKCGLEKLCKWYKTIDESDTYFICLALHPSIKLEYCMDKWDKSYYDAGYSALEHVFDTYYKPPKKPKTSTSTLEVKSQGANSSFNGYGSNWILSSLKRSTSENDVGQDPRKELLDYINSPLEPGDGLNPVKWWGGSSVASERAFSAAGLVGTLQCTHIDPTAFGRVQILRDAYRTKSLNVSDDAASHEAVEIIEIK